MSDGLLFLMMAFASYRLWRVVGLDTWPPSKRLRDWIESRAAFHGGQAVRFEEMGALGDYSAEVRKAGRWHGFWDETLNLIECPWCLGFWASGAVVFAVDLFAVVPLPFLQWFAVSLIVGLIGTHLDGE